MSPEPGFTGTVQPDSTGGLDLTITEQFARSMSLADAMDPDNLLCVEMNSVPLPPDHGYPMRLIAPGWYGVANVKWLSRIELKDTRYQGRFMARDYVSIREEIRGGQTTWTFSSVTHERLKSAPAKVTRLGNRYTVMGAAWGEAIEKVEVQVDAGPWQEARLDRQWSQRIGSTRPGVRLAVLDAGLGNATVGRARDQVSRLRRGRQRPTDAGRPLPHEQADLLGEQRADHPAGARRLTGRWFERPLP